MYSSTLGGTSTRVIEMEESYVLVQGFPYTGTLTANQMVKLGTDGVVVAVAASTDKVLGRIVSSWNGIDATVRVAVPCESMLHGKASGTVTAADQLACTGFDASTGRPIYKTAASGDCVSGIAFIGGATTTDIVVGVLRQPYMI